MLTLEEVKEKIKEQMPECDLVDLLELTTDDIVEAFVDRIEKKYEVFIGMLD